MELSLQTFLESKKALLIACLLPTDAEDPTQYLGSLSLMLPTLPAVLKEEFSLIKLEQEHMRKFLWLAGANHSLNTQVYLGGEIIVSSGLISTSSGINGESCFSSSSHDFCLIRNFGRMNYSAKMIVYIRLQPKVLPGIFVCRTRKKLHMDSSIPTLVLYHQRSTSSSSMKNDSCHGKSRKKKSCGRLEEASQGAFKINT